MSDPAPGEKQQDAKVAAAGRVLRPIAEEADKIGCTVALYNHGGWGGEPENMVAVCEELEMPNVGIVYNQHHGHDHLPRFKDALAKMLPHLHFLNLNGMTAEGDKKGKKIRVLASPFQTEQLTRLGGTGVPLKQRAVAAKVDMFEELFGIKVRVEEG